MTPEELRSIIQGGETLRIEFKGEKREPLNDAGLVEAVVCLANQPAGEGVGYLLIGVEDDGRITGAQPRHDGMIHPNRVSGVISARTRPALSCRVEIVRLDEKDILVIEVPASRVPVGTVDGKYQRRAMSTQGKPECVPYHFHEMQAQQANAGISDFTRLMLPEATWDDLDPIEFDRFRRSIRESRGAGDSALLNLPDTEIAKALGAIETDGPTAKIRLLGLLLFGREEALREQVTTHEVAFQVLTDRQVEVNEFLRWPLLRTMEEILTRFRARNSEKELMLGLLRIGIPDYSELAFREAVANALIHRDYGRNGAVHVQWHPDRIEISNPGGFPEGVRLDNLLVTPPHARNQFLADAFKRAGIVERTGRGIDTIFYEQLRNGRPAPSYDQSTDTGVAVVLHGGEANLEFVKLVTEESQAGRLLGLDELLILNHLWMERHTTTVEAARVIQKSDIQARTVLERLVEAGLVEPRGEGRGRTYQFSAATYRRLGDRAAYVRQRGFEPAQQEQMVLQHARAHGRITRGEAMDLCRLGPDQATRLLSRLVERGELLRHGTRKGAWYAPRA